MILAISGPSSTGKTTIVNDLFNQSTKLKNITGVSEVLKVEETIRKLFSVYYGRKYSSFEELLQNDHDIIEFEILIARDQILNYELYSNDNSTLYICDRCPLDTMVYLSLNYRFTNSEVQSDFKNEYLETLSNLLKCYNTSKIYTYRTLPLDKVENDGFRPLQYLSRKEAELISFDLLDTAIPIVEGDRNQRVQFILNHLGGLFNAKVSW